METNWRTLEGFVHDARLRGKSIMTFRTELDNLPELLRRKFSNENENSHRHGNSPSASFKIADPAIASKAFRELAPQFAYGRHRGPSPKFSHPAAVLIALIPAKGSGWSIPLTLRPVQMVDHAGQISLPGGRAEAGETVWRTACREFGEELGCTTEFLQPIGQLTSLYVYASRHRVVPMVGACSLRPTFRPNPEEVAELIQLPLDQLIADDAISIGTMQRGSVQFDAPGFRVGEHFVWGATALILGEFRELVRSLLDEQSTEPWFL